MEEERERIELLTKKVDELVVILTGIMEDLRQVSGSLKSLTVSQFTKPIAAAVPPSLAAPQGQEKSKAIEDIKMMFPEELESLLSFEERDDCVIVKPRQFLGSENFAKIASTVRGIGGEYISAGKASHFKIPKKAT
ncbi:MAG: hypothetical protein QHH24_03830 [Candidatus Bathyarchaeota archaeon]|jgi:hypothetical protein|nr:hypothetical protein [Candidatus Bathyarchaeota archaeon]